MMVIKKMPHPQKSLDAKELEMRSLLNSKMSKTIKSVDKLHCQLEKEHPKRKTVRLMKATFAGQWHIQGGAQGARAPPLA